MKKENVIQVLKDNKIKFGTIKERIYDLIVEKNFPLCMEYIMTTIGESKLSTICGRISELEKLGLIYCKTTIDNTSYYIATPIDHIEIKKKEYRDKLFNWNINRLVNEFKPEFENFINDYKVQRENL